MEPLRITVTLPSGTAVAVVADGRTAHSAVVTPDGEVTVRTSPIIEQYKEIH